jgi:hypothetical protein
MRFKGTLVLLLLCVGLGAFLYFYEIKGGEQRDKAKQEEKVIWKVPGDDVQQLDLTTQGQHITAVRAADKQWKITAPRSLDADADELNRLLSSASDISRDEMIEENAASLAPFGLDPAQTTVSLKTKDGKVHEIRFGSNNPTGNSTYAALQGKNQVFLVSSSVAGAFNKKLDDLRDKAILKFEQFETQSVDLQTSKGNVNLTKEGDRWWIQSKNKWAADSSAVNSLLGDLANGRIKEFFDENPGDYAGLGLDKPVLDLRLTVGKDKGIRHLTVGLEKSKLVKKGQKAKPEEKKADSTTPVLYIARDESRPELFFVEKEFVDKFLKSPPDLRDKALAIYQRVDIDSITVTNAKGTVSLSKSQAGDWTVGKDKKKAKWDAVNEVFDALGKPVKEFVEEPGALSKYGLDNPGTRVVLKQGAIVKLDCVFGKEAKDGVYAQVLGEPYMKIADKESLAKLGMGESDYLEPPPPPPAPAPASPKK